MKIQVKNSIETCTKYKEERANIKPNGLFESLEREESRGEE